MNLITSSYYPSEMWFLRTLFLQILIIYGCSKISKTHPDICIIGGYIVVLLVALFITDRFAIRSLVGNFPYFTLGYWCRKYDLMKKTSWKVGSVIAVPVYFAIMFSKEFFSSGIILSVLFKLSSITGILSALVLIQIGCKFFNGYTKRMEQLGKKTLEIYTTHFLIIWALRDLGLQIHSSSMYISYLAYMLIVIPITVIAYNSFSKIRGISYLLYAKNK